MGAQETTHDDEVAERREFRRKHLNEGLVFRNLREFPVVERKRRGNKGAHFALAGNRTIDAHISELAPGGHNNEHRHMNEALIYILEGRGHSLIETVDGEKFQIDWSEGDLFSPPLNAWHVHYNDDLDRPARYLAITNVPLMEALDAFTKESRHPAPEG